MNKLQVFGLLVLFLYYGSYFFKLLMQRSHGIKTDRMGCGSKPKRTYIIEIFLKTITFSMAAVQIVSILFNSRFMILISNGIARYIGIVIAYLGFAVFILAMTTMRDSWRAGIDASQKTTFVKTGIYKISRNPAFLGFDLFYIGITISFCNILQLVFTLLAVTMLHLQILEEERFLPTVFGEEYLQYKKTTGRYFLIF